MRIPLPLGRFACLRRPGPVRRRGRADVRGADQEYRPGSRRFRRRRRLASRLRHPGPGRLSRDPRAGAADLAFRKTWPRRAVSWTSRMGPAVLVGHSYGGAIVTEAGNDDHVKALVYIAAHALDVGETEVSNGKKYPNQSADAIVKTPDGFLYLDPEQYPAHFAADLPRAQARFEAHAQMPTSASVFTAAIPDPAWKTKPSWYMVAKADKIINPDLRSACTRRARIAIP